MKKDWQTTQGARSLEEHYARLLGIEAPWLVTRVEAAPGLEQIDVWVEHAPDVALRCPICGATAPGYDRSGERVWRHLDVCLIPLFVHCRLPRCRCPQHGVRRLRAPWEGGCPHFTEGFSHHAIEVLQETMNLSSACRLLGISWKQGCRLREWAVRVALKRRETKPDTHILLGVDEKAFGKGVDFATIVYSHTTRSVLEVVPGRSAEAAAHALSQAIPEPLRDKVQGISMDFSTAYAKAASEVFPQAHQVVDRFHAAALLSTAVDEVRRQSMKRPDCPPSLKNTRLLWLKNLRNLSEEEIARFDRLIELDLPVCEAWHVKYAFRFFYEQPSRAEAMKYFWVWFDWATRARLKPLIRVAKTFWHNIVRLANYHRFGGLTNARAEGFNSKIQSIKSVARGFRNFANYRFAILFHCSRLPLPTHSL